MPGIKLKDTDRIIGKNIKTLRKERKFTLKNVASKLNITLQQLQKYEYAKNRMSASTLYEISKILGHPLRRFFLNEFEKEN
jgi:transcriptional regulator with XRE-family HTH domain